jgi:two-component system chemotaxis response regulator CheB
VKPPAPVASLNADRIVAIGASTGGTLAIERILTKLPPQMPPIVITQHIPAGFSAAFAQRLNKVCGLEVREAQGGETLHAGLALIAPGNHHLVVERVAKNTWRTRLDDGPKVCYQRPSVDVMFQSVVHAAGKSCLAVLLTGMGYDGAEGMSALRKSGAETIAQDEPSCVVFGMPREAIRLGAAQHVLPLEDIAGVLIRQTRAA